MGHQDSTFQRHDHDQHRHTSVRATNSSRTSGKLPSSSVTSPDDLPTQRHKANASQIHQNELQNVSSISCSPTTSFAVQAEAIAPQEYLSKREQVAAADLASPASGSGQASCALSSTMQTLKTAVESGSPASLTSAIHAAVKHLASADPAGSRVPEVSLPASS